MIAAGEVDCFGGEPILHDGALAGYVTSGGFGHRVGVSLALGYVRSEHYRPPRRSSPSRSGASAALRGYSRGRCSIRRGPGCGAEEHAEYCKRL